jgi:hypothetical protein
MSPKRFNRRSVDWVAVMVFGVLALSTAMGVYGYLAPVPR